MTPVIVAPCRLSRGRSVEVPHTVCAWCAGRSSSLHPTQTTLAISRPSSGTPRACVRREPASLPTFFSGAGGLSLGLEKAGCKVIFGADHEPFANRTHAHHFGGMSVDWDLSDATTVGKAAELCRAAGVEIIAGGPPCQPFSKAGRSMIRYRVESGLRDPHDERRDLWRSFLEIVQVVKPRVVMMENVPDMALDRDLEYSEEGSSAPVRVFR